MQYLCERARGKRRDEFSSEARVRARLDLEMEFLRLLLLLLVQPEHLAVPATRTLPKLASILPTAHSRPTSPLYPPSTPGSSTSHHHPSQPSPSPFALASPSPAAPPGASTASTSSRPASPSFSSAHSASPSQENDAFDLATSSRRRPGKRASTMGPSSSSSLPHYVEPDTPMIGSTGRHPRRPGGGGGGAGAGAGVALWKRPRVVGTLLFAALVVLLVLPDDNRARTHGALSKAGVPLPDELPERLQGFLDYINWDDGRNDLRYVPPPPPPIEDEDMGLPDEDLETPHRLEPNGHMVVAPLSTFAEPPKPHPIFTLIKRAEQDWNRKVHKQSKTLKDAVHEYRRRYRRNPPRGFDKWWAYAKANRVILVDEYDQIHRDLEPFWALCVPLSLSFSLAATRARAPRADSSPSRPQRAAGPRAPRPGHAGARRDVHDPGHRRQGGRGRRAGVPAARKGLGRPHPPLLRLRARRQPHLHPPRPAGVPARLLPSRPHGRARPTRRMCVVLLLFLPLRRRSSPLADSRSLSSATAWGPSDYTHDSDPNLSNWAIGCPPASPLRKLEQSILDEIYEEDGDMPKPAIIERFKEAYAASSKAETGTRSYIADYQSALDVCQHPETMNLHGFTSVSGTDPGPLVPLFTFAKTNVHSDILVTPLEQYSDSYIGYDPDWDKKSNDKLMWRGSTTGIDFYVGNDWKNSQRARLHFKANEKDGNEDVLWAEGDGAVQETKYLVNGLNRAYMDVSFAGGPVQCDEPTCKVMAEVIDFKDTMGLSDAYQVRPSSPSPASSMSARS